MNVYDSAQMAELLAPLGYGPAAGPDGADLVILNTCHIREKAAEKVYSELGKIRRLKRERTEQGAEMLIAVDHDVELAESGQEAMAKLDRSHFDLVFTDLAMPEMDGWETARAIRNKFPDIRIVMVTGYGPTTDPPVGEEDLIDGIIGKPFDFTQVGAMLTNLTTNEAETPVV